MSQEKKTNPLFITWQIISTISGIIGMVAMADDVVAWKSFIPKVVDSYTSIVYPVFDFLLGWIPFLQIPGWVKDYLFIGVVVAGSSTKALRAYPIERLSDERQGELIRKLKLRPLIEVFPEGEVQDERARGKGFTFGLYFMTAIITIFIWPWKLLRILYVVMSKKVGKSSVLFQGQHLRERNLYAAMLILAIVVGSLFLLIINIIFL